MSISFARTASIIVLSTLLSTTSVVALMRYTPELMLIPYTPPQIIHENTHASGELTCPARTTNMINIPELETSFRVYQDSEVIVIISTKYNHERETANDQLFSWISISAYMDGLEMPPGVSKLTEHHEGYIPQTIVYHASVKEGQHTLSFKWRNTGYRDGYIEDTIVEVITFPS